MLEIYHTEDANACCFHQYYPFIHHTFVRQSSYDCTRRSPVKTTLLPHSSRVPRAVSTQTTNHTAVIHCQITTDYPSLSADHRLSAGRLGDDGDDGGRVGSDGGGDGERRRLCARRVAPDGRRQRRYCWDGWRSVRAVSATTAVSPTQTRSHHGPATDAGDGQI